MMHKFVFLMVLVFHFGIHAQDIGYTKYETDSLVSYNFYNKTHAPVTLSLKKSSDLSITIPKTTLVCPPQDSLEHVINVPKFYITNDEDFKTSDHIKSTATFGIQLKNENVDHVLYELPFKRNKRYKVIQGFNGRLSHSSELSRYAIDFKMPIGDTIVAARGGRVIRTVDHFTEHGGKSFIDKANQVLIYHEDGTIASYVHLNTNGVLVNVGDLVETGQPIGLSGHTGFSTTPHLHFVVRNFKSAIPVQFKEGKQIGRKSGRWVKKPKN